jgi:hypothetical protein
MLSSGSSWSRIGINRIITQAARSTYRNFNNVKVRSRVVDLELFAEVRFYRKKLYRFIVHNRFQASSQRDPTVFSGKPRVRN